MDLLKVVETMKEEGTSAKRALFNLKIKQGSVSIEMIETVKSVYALTEEELRHLTGWFPQLKGKVSGRHTLVLCSSCHKGDNTAIQALSALIQTPLNGISDDGLFSLEVTGCMGLCALGPNVILDQQIYTSINTNTVFKNRILTILEERKRG